MDQIKIIRVKEDQQLYLFGHDICSIFQIESIPLNDVTIIENDVYITPEKAMHLEISELSHRPEGDFTSSEVKIDEGAGSRNDPAAFQKAARQIIRHAIINFLNKEAEDAKSSPLLLAYLRRSKMGQACILFNSRLVCIDGILYNNHTGEIVEVNL
jgi:hypothetical protein